MSDPGIILHPFRVELALRFPGWDFFHTVRGGIDPDYRFRPGFVGVTNEWKDVCSGDETLSSPGGAGSTTMNSGRG